VIKKSAFISVSGFLFNHDKENYKRVDRQNEQQWWRGLSINRKNLFLLGGVHFIQHNERIMRA
jgi:hypothetical protein